jgi:hypothetical protein
MGRQSAVDWLIDEMFKQGYFYGNKPLSYTNLDHLQNEARKIEIEQQNRLIDMALDAFVMINNLETNKRNG